MVDSRSDVYWYREGVKHGRAEAFEEAAQVVDANMCLADADTDFSDGIAYGTKAIATKLRALAKEPPK